MKRREFIMLLSGAAVAGPRLARAQQPAMPVIGFLSSRSPDESTGLVEAFRRGLDESGYVEGENIAIEYRWADGHYDRLPALAAELVNLRVAVLAAIGGNVAALPAKAATTTIPIVFVIGTDPVNDGLVASFNRPGGNVTGATLYTAVLSSKRLQLLHELIPTATIIGALLNPTNPTAETQSKDLQAAARTLGVQLHILYASTEREVDAVFALLAQQQTGALLVQSEPFFNSKREQIVALAARYRVPASYDFREYATAGGLMSYGASFADSYRQAGLYVGKILKGAKPSELPIMQPTKFEFVLNLKTAKTLGLTVPLIMQMTADEVIE
jgi:putative ABC transport system substrate-binding protein